MLGLESLEGEFVIRDNDEIIRLSRVRDIPPSFDHLIKFAPTPPEPPHDVNTHGLEMIYQRHNTEVFNVG